MSFVSSLQSVNHPTIQAYRRRYVSRVQQISPDSYRMYAERLAGSRAWRELLDDITPDAPSMAVVAEIASAFDYEKFNLEELLEVCRKRDDWPDLLMQHREKFVAAGYPYGDLETIDAYVHRMLTKGHGSGMALNVWAFYEHTDLLSGDRLQPHTLELMADCLAGVWARRAEGLRGFALDEGDIQEGLRAAEAIGDDTLSSGRARPESFTHGTSDQRQRWLSVGYRTGDMQACDTLSAERL